MKISTSTLDAGQARSWDAAKASGKSDGDVTFDGVLSTLGDEGDTSARSVAPDAKPDIKADATTSALAATSTMPAASGSLFLDLVKGAASLVPTIDASRATPTVAVTKALEPAAALVAGNAETAHTTLRPVAEDTASTMRDPAEPATTATSRDPARPSSDKPSADDRDTASSTNPTPAPITTDQSAASVVASGFLGMVMPVSTTTTTTVTTSTSVRDAKTSVAASSAPVMTLSVGTDGTSPPVAAAFTEVQAAHPDPIAQIVVGDVSMATYLAPVTAFAASSDRLAAGLSPTSSLLATPSTSRASTASSVSGDASTARSGDVTPELWPSPFAASSTSGTSADPGPSADAGSSKQDERSHSSAATETPSPSTSVPSVPTAVVGPEAAAGQAMAMSPPTRAVFDAVSALAARAAAPAEAVMSTAVTATPARTMVLQLTSGESGPISVRLHLTGRTLDVSLTTSDSRTAGQLDRDRDALGQALSDNDYHLNSLVIQGQATSDSGAASAGESSASTSDTSERQPASDGGAGSTGGDGRPASDDRSGRDGRARDSRPGAPSRAAGGGLFV